MNPVGKYLFRVNNGNTRTINELFSKLTIKTTKRLNLRRSGEQYYFEQYSGGRNKCHLENGLKFVSNI